MKPTPFDLEHGHPQHRCDNAFELAMQKDVRVIPCLSELLTQGALTILSLEARVGSLERQLEIETDTQKRKSLQGWIRRLEKNELKKGR